MWRSRRSLNIKNGACCLDRSSQRFDRGASDDTGFDSLISACVIEYCEGRLSWWQRNTQEPPVWSTRVTYILPYPATADAESMQASVRPIICHTY